MNQTEGKNFLQLLEITYRKNATVILTSQKINLFKIANLKRLSTVNTFI